MKLKDITHLIKLIEKSDLSEFKMKQGDFELSLRTSKYVHPRAISMKTQQAEIPQPPTTDAKTVVESKAGEADAGDAADTSQSKDSELLEVKSPIVGTFYRAPSPDKPPFVKVGDSIAKGDVVCIVEAMKLFNEIESEVSGKIVKVLIEDATPVEFDQSLFLVDPNA